MVNELLRIEYEIAEPVAIYIYYKIAFRFSHNKLYTEYSIFEMLKA